MRWVKWLGATTAGPACFRWLAMAVLTLHFYAAPARDASAQGFCDGGVACDAYGVDACDAYASDDNCHCGSLLERFRADMADCGITFQNNLTQFYFGTVSGGLEREFAYGGHGDYVANFDLGKAGIHDGLLVKLRAEHRFGESAGPFTGSFLPATLATELPVANSTELYLTNVLFTQFLSERFAVYAGKLDTLDGDLNAYAHGRGIRQFSNTAFIVNPLALRTIPYSTLGCGFFILGAEGTPLLNFTVLNPTDTADSDGFDELFAEGVSLSTELRFATPLMGKPGHQLFGFTWSSRDYVALGQDPRIILPNVPINRADGSWSFYWNTDQALWVDPCDPTRHWGYFARAGVADEDANPLSYLLNFGLGGASPLRRGDSFGAGYFYSGTSDEIGPFLQIPFGPIDDGQGVELFYNIQIGKSLTVTPDFQWLDSARENVDDAYVMGLRANLAF
ncbi:carbohydrate porin [Crateriforma conspicua]|uniref:carbohydrate porin n=1 Tax=Crateriforma conspicua TaxID=2527996 RepID=UPI0011895C06|nr:carbohydrate porin [Crateriforma conspicua]QDV64995.1 Carbohydrate-selective porin, OprB family [Crateriforma conspicua]